MVAYIRVRTRCVETGWHGGCDRSEPVCSASQIGMIFTALDAINARVDSCTLTGLTGLKNCIRNAFDTVVWTCGNLGDSIVAQAILTLPIAVMSYLLMARIVFRGTQRNSETEDSN